MLKTAALEETEQTDSATGLKIRVSTTARLRFREKFPDKFAAMRNMRLNDRIGFFFDKAGSNVEHYFKLGSGEDMEVQLAEIRKGGDFYYISAIRNGYIDILTIQSDWRRPRGKTVPDAAPAEEDFTLASVREQMKKFANIQAVWPQIYGMLKTPPQGINLGQFPGQLPPMNKIVIDSMPHQDAPGAVGFVTTEDVDKDGVLDTIHLSSQRFMQELERHGIGANEVMQLNQLPKERLASLLSAFVDVISHELGHVKDYRHGETNPFPGGEGVAESAGRQALQQISVATNKTDSVQDRRLNMSVLKVLANLANKMDELGETKIADEITSLMEKQALRPPWKLPELGEKMESSEEALEKAKRMNIPVEPLSLGKKPEVKPEGLEVDVPKAAPELAAPQITEPVAKPAPLSMEPTDLGSIQIPGDPYTYDYLPEEEAFLVKSYSGTDERGRRAVGAKITRSNEKAWSILSKYIPSGEMTPADGRPLITASDNPEKDWVEAQAQFRGWINSGYFGNQAPLLMKRYPDVYPSIVKLMNAELSPQEAISALKEEIKILDRRTDGKYISQNKESYLKYLEELYAAAERALQEVVEPHPYEAQPAPANDFVLANNESVNEMKKQASQNVKKLEELFSGPRGYGPFGRD